MSQFLHHACPTFIFFEKLKGQGSFFIFGWEWEGVKSNSSNYKFGKIFEDAVDVYIYQL